MRCRLRSHNNKSLTVGSTSWIGRVRVVFHGKRFSGALAVAGLNADRYPSGGRGGHRRRICLVRATALGIGRRIPEGLRRGSDSHSARPSASSSDISQHPQSPTTALSVWHVLPNLPGLNCGRRVHAWETRSQALAGEKLTANSAFDRTTFRRRCAALRSAGAAGQRGR